MNEVYAVKEKRLTKILLILMNGKKMEAAKLAKMFDVGRVTVYRDIKLLNRLGFLIDSETGAVGGYQLSSNFTEQFGEVSKSDNPDELATKLANVVSQKLDEMQTNYVQHAKELKTRLDSSGLSVNEFVNLCDLINQYNGLHSHAKIYLNELGTSVNAKSSVLERINKYKKGIDTQMGQSSVTRRTSVTYSSYTTFLNRLICARRTKGFAYYQITGGKKLRTYIQNKI